MKKLLARYFLLNGLFVSLGSCLIIYGFFLNAFWRIMLLFSIFSIFSIVPYIAFIFTFLWYCIKDITKASKITLFLLPFIGYPINYFIFLFTFDKKWYWGFDLDLFLYSVLFGSLPLLIVSIANIYFAKKIKAIYRNE